MDAVTIAAGVNAGRWRAVDVVEEALARIAARDGDLRAFREVWPERAREVARAVDGAGRRLPLAGVPLGVKAWERLDSAQVTRLVAAGCVPVGATAVPAATAARGAAAAREWQTWGHTDRGPTVNPWRADRTPGGSSAGSAAAVAAGLVPLATGIDGAGSVRIPAAWCGVVGVKVTNPDPRRLAAPGPLAGSVADAAAYLGIGVVGDSAAVRAVWSADLGFAAVDERVVAVARSAAGRLFAAGVVRVDHDVVLADPADTWFAVRRGVPVDRGSNDRRLAAVFEVADVLLTPTTPVSAHGHDGPGDVMSVSLTWAFNLSGHPAASVPAGLGPDGVPVGLQVVGRHGAERTVLRVASMVEGHR